MQERSCNLSTTQT